MAFLSPPLVLTRLGERERGNNVIGRPTQNNANKNWINKLIGGETKNISSYRYHYLLTPPPLAPPPSPLIAQLFGPNVPVLRQAERPIWYKRKKKAVNAEKICKMEPLSILRKMAQ